MARGKHSAQKNTWTKKRNLVLGGFLVGVLILGSTVLLNSDIAFLQNLHTPQHISIDSTPTQTTHEQLFSATQIKNVQLAAQTKEEAEKYERMKAQEEEAEEAKQAAQDISDTITAAVILEGVSEADGLQAFSLNPERDAPTIPQDKHNAVLSAGQAILNEGYLCSGIIIDMQSGRGVAFNAGSAPYVASAFKAPCSFYLISNNIASEWEYSYIESSILYSDNEAYEALASAHIDETYKNWLEEHGIVYDSWSPWYPHASARGMAACWADIFQYVENDQTDGPWFRDLLTHTNLSFIRNALEGEDIEILNKGGWMSDPEYNSVTDCGIIYTQGRSYLIAALSNQPSYGEAHEHLYALVKALYTARESLK